MSNINTPYNICKYLQLSAKSGVEYVNICRCYPDNGNIQILKMLFREYIEYFLWDYDSTRRIFFIWSNVLSTTYKPFIEQQKLTLKYDCAHRNMS